MILKNRFSLFLATFIIIGFFFLALPEKGFSGIGPTSLGCCLDVEFFCVGCEGACAITDEQCSAEGGSFNAKPNVSTFCHASGRRCTAVQTGGGCCVLSEGNCTETQLELTECEIQQGIEWVFDTECSEVPQCRSDIVSPIPALSQWGLIAIAGVLGIIGFMFIRRRKVSA